MGNFFFVTFSGFVLEGFGNQKPNLLDAYPRSATTRVLSTNTA